MTRPDGEKQPAGGHEPMKDPVCGMTVAADSPNRLEHAGRKYVFCSSGCMEKFRKEPERYGA